MERETHCSVRLGELTEASVVGGRGPKVGGAGD